MRKHKTKIIIAAVVLATLTGAWFWGNTSTVNPPDISPVIAATEAATEPNITEAAASLAAVDVTSGTPQGSLNGDETEPSVTAPEGDSDVLSNEAGGQTMPGESTDEDDTQDVSAEQLIEDDTQLVIGAPADESPVQATPDDSTDEAADQTMPIESSDLTVTPEAAHVAAPETQEHEAAPPEMREPVEPEDMTVGEGSFTVTLSVSVHRIVQNMHLLNSDKHELVPADGIIFPPTEVTAYEGESVFNVLQREMRRNRIHMVSRFTPVFNSAYVEAINNLYEFDVGPLSGWMYRVNGWFPNFGSSRYLLSAGDEIEWVFTVDLGRDFGVYWANGQRDD